MSIEGIGNSSVYYSNNPINRNNNQKEQAASAFYNKVEETSKSNAATAKTNTSESSGDIVMRIPPSIDSTYSRGTNKSTDEMTMDEYKQYICNEIANLPMSTCFRTQHTGQLIIKEEAFEHMKNDPKYEKTVINMLREGFNVQHMYAPCYGMQVIGGTMEETYGYGVPLNSSSTNSIGASNEKTWWEKRQEKFEELSEDQVKKAQKKCAVQKTVQMQELLAFQQQQRSIYSNILTSENQDTEVSLKSARRTVTMKTVPKAIDAYEKNVLSV